MTDEPVESATDPAQADGRQRPLRIFISYRHEDTTAGTAHLLQDELRSEKGPLRDAHVFVDNGIDDGISGGDRWWATIESEIASADTVIALIGVHWQALAHRRSPGEDVPRRELRLALQKGCHLLPILVDDAKMPPPLEGLPALSALHALPFRHARRQDDLPPILDRIAELGPRPAIGSVEVNLPPESAHHRDVAGALQSGKLVVCLGWDLAAPLNEAEFAARLASRAREVLGLTDDPALDSRGLAEVAQHLSLMSESELFEALRVVLTDGQPTETHRFLASLPEQLRNAGAPDPYQMIVTANYDNALEQAFSDAGEMYDLAIYTTTRSRSQGRFVHVDENGESREAFPANLYSEFPIQDGNRLERPLIVKIHGAFSDRRLAAIFPSDDNYVVTENDYIDFLPRGAGDIPNQILQKLTRSHVLFLGYSLTDWNLRVFVQRVWPDGFNNRTWAVRKATSPVEELFWDAIRKVQFVDSDIETYVSELRKHLSLRSPEAVAS